MPQVIEKEEEEKLKSWHKKSNVISRMDWLMGFGYFREISFPRKKFPIYMEPLTRGYWSTEMDHRHNPLEI